jgi:hypothetical protein
LVHEDVADLPGYVVRRAVDVERVVDRPANASRVAVQGDDGFLAVQLDERAGAEVADAAVTEAGDPRPIGTCGRTCPFRKLMISWNE